MPAFFSFSCTCGNGELTAEHTHVVMGNGKHLQRVSAGRVGAGTSPAVPEGRHETNKSHCRLPCALRPCCGERPDPERPAGVPPVAGARRGIAAVRLARCAQVKEAEGLVGGAQEEHKKQGRAAAAFPGLRFPEQQLHPGWCGEK